MSGHQRASAAGVVGNELGDHFNERRALLREVRVRPRLVSVGIRARARLGVGKGEGEGVGEGEG